MKTKLFAAIVITIITFNHLFAQQIKIDNGLLLEYYQAQRYQDATDYLKKNYPEPVTNLKALGQLAYTSQMANKLPEAQAYYQRIYDLDSTDQSALFSIGNINLRRGSYQKAELFFKRILLKDTTNILVYTKLAAIAVNKKDTLAAIAYFDKANKLNPADVDVAVDLSKFYMAQKNFPQALRVLNKASETDPDNIFILENMVMLLYKEKKWAETINSVQKLIALDAANSQTIYYLGVSYYNLKNFACGAEILAGLPVPDQTEYSCYFAALCYKGLKDYNQSILWLSNAIKQGVSGNVASYYGEIADNNEKMIKYKKAIASYQKALQFNEDPGIYTALANLYENQLKDKVIAAKYYKQATALYKNMFPINNTTPINYYLLATIFDAKLKDTASAIKYYKKYLDSKPPEKQQTYIVYTKSRIDQLQTKN